ncbi:hypothetical protein ACFWY9_37540 [Amycolatopsis sp. NPDC059027]|uniref:hypothetical protein n=1 Tax=unclassified Amycolatopsis TaxID=2618356 RepID=UPI0036723E29
MQVESGDEKRSAVDREATGNARHEREQAADEREQAADEREQAADEREQAADVRERIADDREGRADVREEGLAGWERRLDRRDRVRGAPVASPWERGQEAAVRARALLTASMARLDRSEEALRRARQWQEREQDAVDREIAASRRERSSSLDRQATGSLLAAAADALRTQLVATARELAEVEESFADHHDRLAQEDSDGAADRRLAEAARARARVARETAERFLP